MLLRPELSKNALTSGIFKSSLIAINSATGYYEYIVKLTFSVYLIEVKFENGTSQKIVIGHDKRGDVMAMDAATGKPLWSNVIGTLYRTDAIPMINGSGEIWPGTQYGIEAYTAADKNGMYT